MIELKNILTRYIEESKYLTSEELEPILLDFSSICS